MTLPLTFDLLALAILAAWLPTLRLGEYRVPPWTALLVLAVIAGAGVRVLTWSALGTLAALCTFAWAGQTAPRRRPVYVALAALLALAMSLHWMRGFHNPVQFAGVRLTPDSAPLIQSLNFDKGAAGLVLLAAFCARSTSVREFARRGPTIVVAAIATATLAIGLALALGYVRFEPKLPDGTQAFLVTNLFFTCVAEEAFFRGLIQERLMRLADSRRQPAWTWIAVVVSAVLFGLAHAGGGVTWMLIATLAGFGYAAVYARTRTIEGPILVHFAVNAVHFLFFTYPALAG
jgi:membrane protease YdiL (CAAX protease family)